MKKFYEYFCKIEELVTMTFLTAITGLVFLSAVVRTFKHPINWAQDLSLLLFAWVVFFGADMALRTTDFVRVDMLVRRLPEKIRTAIYYLWNIVILGFLGILIIFSLPLCFENAKRLFQTLGISYSWATASIPVGSLLLSITIIIKTVKHAKEDFGKKKEVKD